MRLKARSTGPVEGRVRPPGDKSISHRALILGALAEGETVIEGLLEAEDVLHTAGAVRAFGAQADKGADGRWRVRGAGGFRQPPGPIECGNSGTAVRLLMGAAAAYPLSARFDAPQGRLPLIVHGGKLQGIAYRSPVASAQVKSAVLLAGLGAEGETVLIEPERSRDHTERMLGVFGANIDEVEVDGLMRPRVRRSQLAAAPVYVPADPSSAAFPAAAALLCGKSEIVIEDVLVNPLRLGLYETLLEMGAKLSFEESRDPIGEPIANLVVRASELMGVSPPTRRAPAMIDEYPILSVLAAFAEGETRLTGATELRVKESDRISLVAEGLRACGVEVEELEDGLIVRGRGPKGVRGGAEVRTMGDHRVAMSFLVLGLASKEPVIVDEAEMIATSFPGFADMMRQLGARIEQA